MGTRIINGLPSVLVRDVARPVEALRVDAPVAVTTDKREPARVTSRFAAPAGSVLPATAETLVASGARAARALPAGLETAVAGRAAADVKPDPVTQVVDIYHGTSATAGNALQRITTSGLNGCGVGVVVTEFGGVRTAQLAHFPDLAAGRMLDTMKSLMPRPPEGARTELFFLTGARRFSDSALQGLVKGMREHLGDVSVKTEQYATRGGASAAEGYGTVTLEIPKTGNVRLLGWEKDYLVMADKPSA